MGVTWPPTINPNGRKTRVLSKFTGAKSNFVLVPSHSWFFPLSLFCSVFISVSDFSESGRTSRHNSLLFSLQYSSHCPLLLRQNETHSSSPVQRVSSCGEALRCEGADDGVGVVSIVPFSLCSETQLLTNTTTKINNPIIKYLFGEFILHSFVYFCAIITFRYLWDCTL